MFLKLQAWKISITVVVRLNLTMFLVLCSINLLAWKIHITVDGSQM